MQTWITDYNFLDSAENLDFKRLHSQIYEGIHVLASLLGISDKLVNPKRSVKNHPVAKLWAGFEIDLWKYIMWHKTVWIKRNYKYENTINQKNYFFITDLLQNKIKRYDFSDQPIWITDELIRVHRSVLIQKKPEHYRKLWQDVPEGLKMRYDWR